MKRKSVQCLISRVEGGEGVSDCSRYVTKTFLDLLLTGNYRSAGNTHIRNRAQSIILFAKHKKKTVDVFLSLT